jgi:hypothetical protein
VGDSELRVVASQDIGPLGSHEGPPVAFHWRWYYHLPALGLWALLLVLLVAPKANRRREAWLILAPLGLVLLVWRMPAVLFGMSDSATETLGFFVVSGTMAWSMVWLLGPWLANGRRYVTFLLSLATMLAAGLLSYGCCFPGTEDLAEVLTYYGLCVATLLLAMMSTGYFCRKNYSPPRFLRRLIVWNVVAALGVLLTFVLIVTIVVIVVTIINYGHVLHSVRDLVQPAILVVVASAALGGILYLLNLPFLILAFNSPLYEDRFERMFHVGEDRAEPRGIHHGGTEDTERA